MIQMKKLDIKSEKILVKKSPNRIEAKEIRHEIANKINLLIFEILVFLIPYVTPIPKESRLLDIAKRIELINIIIPPNL